MAQRAEVDGVDEVASTIQHYPALIYIDQNRSRQLFMNSDDLDMCQNCIILSPGREAIAAASIGVVSVGSLVKEITRWELLSDLSLFFHILSPLLLQNPVNQM